MTLEELFSIQTDNNNLKSLYIELANLENFNPYKNNIISDMPKGGGNGKNFAEWYTEEKERIEKEIEFWKEKIQIDRKKVDEFISQAPFPERDIIRYRAINNMSWYDIGSMLSMDRRTVSRKFYRYLEKLPTMPTHNVLL